MNESEIKLYLKAKSQNSGFNRLISLALLVVVFFFILFTQVGINFQYMNAIGFGSITAYIFQNKEFKLFGSRIVTSNDLIEIIEKQINNDPSLLMKLKNNT